MRKSAMDSEMQGSDIQINSPSPLQPALQPSTRAPKIAKEPARYPCSHLDCPKSFTRKSDLKDHFRKHTGGEPPHGCTLCIMKFFTKRDKKRHELLHTEETKFVCRGKLMIDGKRVFWGCGKTFSREDNIMVHLKTHEECTSKVQEHLVSKFYRELRKAPRYDTADGNWYCRCHKPWCKSPEGSFGCGKQFKSKKLLELHFFPEKDGGSGRFDEGIEETSCNSPLFLDCSRKAVQLVQQGLKRQRGRDDRPISPRTSDGADPEPLGRVAVQLIVTANSLGTRIDFSFPRRETSWKPFEFELYMLGPEGNCSNCSRRLITGHQDNLYHNYRLNLTTAEYQYASTNGMAISMKLNLTGDLNGGTYWSMKFIGHRGAQRKGVSLIGEHTVECTVETMSFRQVPERISYAGLDVGGKVVE